MLEAMRSFLSPYRPVTVRYCLYQLVSRGLLASTSAKCYRALKELCVTARISGELDDACFVDNKRERIRYEYGWVNLWAYQKRPQPKYYRNYWAEQSVHVECWLEKDTTRVLVEQVASQRGITLGISSGAFSRPFRVEAAQDFARIVALKRIVIFYVGDFDPSGLDIERAAREGNELEGNRRREGLRQILMEKHGWSEKDFQKRIHWKRIAVTEADFLAMPDKYKLDVKDAGEEDGRPTKGDPRAPAFVEQYGSRCLEVEALEVLKERKLGNRLEHAIQSVIDHKRWQQSIAREERERKTGKSAPWEPRPGVLLNRWKT